MQCVWQVGACLCGWCGECACLGCVCDVYCVLGGAGVARGDISVRWELTFQGLLPREVRVISI